MHPKHADTGHPIHEVTARRWSPYVLSDRPVHSADLCSIFEAARWAPSSYNEHKQSVTACLRSPGDGATRARVIQTFGTTTAELERLRAWLLAAGCTHVALESTGVYWRPVSNVLEGSLDLALANARHVKMVPGRKTDVHLTRYHAKRLTALGDTVTLTKAAA